MSSSIYLKKRSNLNFFYFLFFILFISFILFFIFYFVNKTLEAKQCETMQNMSFFYMRNTNYKRNEPKRNVHKRNEPKRWKRNEPKLCETELFFNTEPEAKLSETESVSLRFALNRNFFCCKTGTP